ncbi:unnamed protein product [Enterobius vermicularis]|uniref:L-2-amino-thiazoline-4-carboxylic acid hydrolase n=1 Tax=Enterobius vermicularis TaxID=51028 RepID=A0A0N4USZ9_ENTVE|nr:unnamed protein product [Enterobius vermicularis]
MIAREITARLESSDLRIVDGWEGIKSGKFAPEYFTSPHQQYQDFTEAFGLSKSGRLLHWEEGRRFEREYFYACQGKHEEQELLPLKVKLKLNSSVAQFMETEWSRDKSLLDVLADKGYPWGKENMTLRYTWVGQENCICRKKQCERKQHKAL